MPVRGSPARTRPPEDQRCAPTSTTARAADVGSDQQRGAAAREAHAQDQQRRAAAGHTPIPWIDRRRAPRRPDASFPLTRARPATASTNTVANRSVLAENQYAASRFWGASNTRSPRRRRPPRSAQRPQQQRRQSRNAGVQRDRERGERYAARLRPPQQPPDQPWAAVGSTRRRAGRKRTAPTGWARDARRPGTGDRRRGRWSRRKNGTATTMRAATPRDGRRRRHEPLLGESLPRPRDPRAY